MPGLLAFGLACLAGEGGEAEDGGRGGRTNPKTDRRHSERDSGVGARRLRARRGHPQSRAAIGLAIEVRMRKRDPDLVRQARAYMRLTVVILGCNVILFLLSIVFITARPMLSLVLGGLNVLALGALVFVDRRVVGLGIPSFWRNGRLHPPE